MKRPGRFLAAIVGVGVFALTPAHASGTIAPFAAAHSETYSGADPDCRFTQAWVKSPTFHEVKSLALKGVMSCGTALAVSAEIGIQDDLHAVQFERTFDGTTTAFSLAGDFVPPATGGLYHFTFTLYFDYDLGIHFTGWPEQCQAFLPNYDFLSDGPDPSQWEQPDPYYACIFTEDVFVPPAPLRLIKKHAPHA